MGIKNSQIPKTEIKLEDFEVMDFLEKSDIKFPETYKIKSPALSTNKYEEIREALYISTDEKRIIRTIPKYNYYEEELSEIKIGISDIRSLNHKSIIKIYQFIEDDNYFYIIEEYFTGKPLVDFVKISVFSEIIAKEIISQILSFLEYYHEKENKIYLDLSLENIFWNGTAVKLKKFRNFIDCKKSLKRTNINIQTHYMSPELIKGKFCKKSDIWSLGIVLFLLLKGEVPFHGKDDKEIKYHILNYDIDLTESVFYSNESKDLIKSMLIKNPDKRISLTNIKNHPFLK
jgi:calcium-dependent protein kinase